MLIASTDIPGCFTLRSTPRGDSRGSFLKTFHADTFAAAGLRTDWRETYVTQSARGVVRGMHFQSPPADHAKAVFCLDGEVHDVVLDLRRGSPTFRQARAFELRAKEGDGVYAPSGCAHGFLGISDTNTLLYQVTSVHAGRQDCGIAWDSFGFDWAVAEPILSQRDREHPPLDAFVTPFVFDPAAPCR